MDKKKKAGKENPDNPSIPSEKYPDFKDSPLPSYKDMKSVKTDPNGSYTGVCGNLYETPVQDADDL